MTRDKRVFVDVETTGLDPATGLLLEVGILVTDLDCRPLGTCYQYSVVLPINPMTAWEACDPYVQKMHTENGLFEDLDKPNNRTVEEIENSILQFLASVGVAPNAKTEICGYNPGFDLDWLKAHLPKVASCFTHRKLDVRSVALVMTGLGYDSPERLDHTTHRALNDCISAAHDLAYWQGLIVKVS